MCLLQINLPATPTSSLTALGTWENQSIVHTGNLIPFEMSIILPIGESTIKVESNHCPQMHSLAMFALFLFIVPKRRTLGRFPERIGDREQFCDVV